MSYGPRAICLKSNCRVHGPDDLCDNCRANEYIDQLEKDVTELIKDNDHLEDRIAVLMSKYALPGYL